MSRRATDLHSPSVPRVPPLFQCQWDRGAPASPAPTRHGSNRASPGAGRPPQAPGGRGHVSPHPGCGPSPQPRTSAAQQPPLTPPWPPLRSVPLLGSKSGHSSAGRSTWPQPPAAAPADHECGWGPNSHLPARWSLVRPLSAVPGSSRTLQFKSSFGSRLLLQAWPHSKVALPMKGFDYLGRSNSL
ncbi:hypothetical protein NDU88_000341 [Pleurodeles waltl]|uniref:Uncharacterized protein n=1 Tax=Pleurodeles waltl TaxID=8319 RepID=A0AAV7P3H2_PLEWA|nr:hypothetical protein NDU88_000341 [Pleurodeles waltl]